MEDPKLEDIYRLTLDTNRVVHKMRRGLWYGRIFQVVWWVAVLVASGYAYYSYAQPYVDKIIKIYAQVQQGTAQAQTLQSEVSNFFGNWTAQHPTTTATTTKH
jgi:hypothetical protein